MKKRGRETAGDMIRSLAVVMVLVLMMWWLAQPPDSDEQALRTVDPSGDVAAFQADAPTVPAPTGLPEQWRSTSSTLGVDSLRIGFVTPAGEYAEYAATALPAGDARRDLARLFLAGGGPPGFELVARRRYREWTARNATLLRHGPDDGVEPWGDALVLVLTTVVSEAGHEVAVCEDEATAERLAGDVLALIGRIGGSPP